MLTNGQYYRVLMAMAFIVFITGVGLLPGCHQMSRMESGAVAPPPASMPAMERKTAPSAPMANGGTTPPNGAAYDAMFFESYGVNPFIDTDDNNLSTFAVDVDTASYTISRKYIFDGNVPPKEAVRVEEFVNYFKYNYPDPGSKAFGVYIDGAPSKFGGENYNLVRIGLQGRTIEPGDRKNAILTFVIDVSGSMSREDRLELVKRALRLLVDQLVEGDKVAIVVYGSRGRVVMEHKGIDRKKDILSAIESLQPEGATNADEGLELGYKLAAKAYKENAINRIILCSDGVANMGETGANGILNKIENYAAKGIYLSTIGFGMGNYNDVLMEQLADKGNGNYAYVDTFSEAKRIFLENLTSMLQVIAKDVKIQVAFNPEVVSRFRLVGYENRVLNDEDFRNDKVDAGEIGSGHQVTALYEIKFHKNATGGKVATVSLRYKNPDRESDVTELSKTLEMGDLADSFGSASPDLRLASAVAEFAEILRKSYWARDGKISEAVSVIHSLPQDYRSRPEIVELTDIMSKAMALETD